MIEHHVNSCDGSCVFITNPPHLPTHFTSYNDRRHDYYSCWCSHFDLKLS